MRPTRLWVQNCRVDADSAPVLLQPSVGETDDTGNEELSERVSADRMISATENNTLSRVDKWVDDGEGAAVLRGARGGLLTRRRGQTLREVEETACSCEEEESSHCKGPEARACVEAKRRRWYGWTWT